MCVRLRALTAEGKIYLFDVVSVCLTGSGWQAHICDARSFGEQFFVRSSFAFCFKGTLASVLSFLPIFQSG